MKSKIIVVLAALLAFSGCLSAQTIDSPEVKNLAVAGLKQEVAIRRDSRWIPYIEAQNESDLYFAQGFVTASDRLWQMDLYRRVASGRTAELFGKLTLEEDKRWRRFGFGSIVEESYKTMPNELKRVLDDYARGVNAYIATLNKDSLPVEFQVLQYSPEPWKPSDSLIIGKILADGLSTSWFEDALKARFSNLPKEKFDQLFIEKTPFDVLVVGKDSEESSKAAKSDAAISNAEEIYQLAERESIIRKSSLERIGFYQDFNAASNNWVVSGKRTLDGKPILANDPHLDGTAPSIWYLSNLSSPKGRVSGVTFPGTPGIVLGHNEFIAWGATNLGPDVQDLYIETFNDKNQTLTGDRWTDAKVRNEEIKVRKGLIGPETESVDFEVIETDDGVVIQDKGEKKTALKWTARYPENNEFTAFYYVNHAKNWEEFKSALKTYGGATQNFVYADVKGNIGFHNGGAIPIRSSGDGSIPYDGSKNEGKWTKFIPFDELPESYNPPEGFIVTANQRLAGDSYKHFLGHSWADPYRARRIHDLIANNSKMTINDSMDIQRDIFSISYSNFAREIIKMGAASEETLKALRSFDGKISPDSKEALLISEIRKAFLNTILRGNLGELEANSYRWSMQNSFIDWLVREKPANWMTKELGDYKAVLIESDKYARETLMKKFGTDEKNWRYGKSSTFNFRHPLAAAPLIGSIFATPSFESYGGFSTPNVGSAVSMRHVTSPGNWDQTRHGIALGQSGDPKSPYFKDQFDGWRSGNTPVFPFTKEAVEKTAISVTRLSAK
ncbi:MAG: penicillin acylase family protein [Pyrinomonadaceae bacterium]|nr:penicillin acylase family protein [Pyrinomonadaceae bacterium]